MRRIIKNSTAIIACLSLLTPHLAWAQDEGGPKRQRPAAAEELRPEITNKKPQENARQQQRKNAERQKKKNAQKQLELRREKQAEAKAKSVEQQKKQAERQKKQAERKRRQAQQQENRQNAQERDRAKAQLDRKAESGDAKEKTPPRVKAEQAKKNRDNRDRPRKAENRKDRADTDNPRKELGSRTDGKPPANKPDRKNPKRAEREKKADRQRDREISREQRERKQRERRREQDRRVQLSQSDIATERQGSMGGLNTVLQNEVRSGLDESRLTCLSGAAYPCNDGSAAITPGGVVLDRQKNGRFVMAPAARQMYRVNDNGKVVRRVAEEGSTQTAIARELARATGIPRAAALIEGGRRGNIFEQRVTRENSRSSSEDFATSLRDGWRGSYDRRDWRDRNSDDDDDDDNDLTKALLLGLGALAVGSMLNNNREVALSTPDRVVVTHPDGSQEIIKDEVALLREPGSTVTTENFDDGSSRTIVTREDGSKIVTIRDANLRVLRRSLISPDGQSTPLIDDTVDVAPVDIAELPAPISPSPYGGGALDEEELREALRREADIDRRFSLAQIRNIPEVRSLVAPVNIEGISFDTGSAAIRPEQADRLETLGNVIKDTIQQNPNEIFLIEGHTDTVGASAMNLALSDRRAESVALALSEYYEVPPENLVVQGYGEQYPRIRSEGDIRENRRASVRRITDLLQGAE